MNPLHRDAHVVRGELILARWLHGDAELRTVDEGEEQIGQGDGHDDDRNLVEPQHGGAERPVHSRDRAFQHLGFVAPDRAGDEAPHETDCDCEDHHRHLRLAKDMAQNCPLQQPPGRGQGSNCADAR